MHGVEQGAAASGFILTIVQTVKTFIPKKWYDVILPFLAFALGIAYRVWLDPDTALTLGQQVIEGFRDGSFAIATFVVGYKVKDVIKNGNQET